jgi:hypothetical protein
MALSARRKQEDVRGNRIQVLVSEAEQEQIEAHAAAADRSVSAYLRDLALGEPSDGMEREAMRQFDAILDSMAEALDGAMEAVEAANARMDRMDAQK